MPSSVTLYVPYTCVLWTEQTVFIEGTDTRVHLPVRPSVCTPSVSPSTCVSVLWRVCVGCMDPNAWTRRMFHSTCFNIQFSHLCQPPFASSSSIQRSVSSSVSLLNSLCVSLFTRSPLHLLYISCPLFSRRHRRLSVIARDSCHSRSPRWVAMTTL